MEWTERNRYQASWGAWYVQTEIGCQVVEWKFDHSPTFGEIGPIAQRVLGDSVVTRGIDIDYT